MRVSNDTVLSGYLTPVLRRAALSVDSCLYLANNFLGSSDQLATHGVCLCDDDNDLDMALACRHAYIPSVTSDSMAKAIQNHPTRFTTTFDSFNVVAGTASTEAALEAVLTIMERRAPR